MNGFSWFSVTFHCVQSCLPSSNQVQPNNPFKFVNVYGLHGLNNQIIEKTDTLTHRHGKVEKYSVRAESAICKFISTSTKVIINIEQTSRNRNRRHSSIFNWLVVCTWVFLPIDHGSSKQDLGGKKYYFKPTNMSFGNYLLLE